jgi:catechol 2,3-dioxygenase
MAPKCVLPGYIQIRALDLNAAVEHHVDRLGLHRVSREPDGRVYLRALDEFDRHSVALRQAGMPGMDYVGFKVASEADLDSFCHRIEDFGTRWGRCPPAGSRVSAVG